MHSRDDLVARLFGRTTGGIRFGLDRIRKAAELLGNPQDSYAIIHVAGTNGKGSVCAFLESILRGRGYTTGLFTSPHLVSFEERFIVNGRCVRPDEWIAVYRDIENIVDRFSLTFFEISTLIAFELFRRRGLEWVVLETGLGGRLDATNIVRPAATVITSLSVDHREYLGNDILSVAREKLGIVKNGVPLVMSRQYDERTVDLARQRCNESRSPFFPADERVLERVEDDRGENRFYYNQRLFEVNLYGEYQLRNVLCAIKTLEALDIPVDDAVVHAIKNTFLPGRFQVFTVDDRRIVFDAAHNPDAARHFCLAVRARFAGKPVCIIAGIMADKDCEKMLAHYATVADTIILTRPDTPRAADARALHKAVPGDFAGKTIVTSRVAEAIACARSDLTGVISVTGSFFTVGEAMASLGLSPYGD